MDQKTNTGVETEISDILANIVKSGFDKKKSNKLTGGCNRLAHLYAIIDSRIWPAIIDSRLIR
jgi:hypothetical protein